MITRTRAVLMGLAALAALLAVEIGLPAVLYKFGGSPLPGHLAGWRRIATVLSSRDDGELLLAIIRACSWLAWLLFTVCVLAETQAAMRGRRAPRLRLGGLQGAAAHLVALAALAFATPSAITLSASVRGTPAELRAPPSLAQLDADTATPGSDVVVRVGDCLWSIAQHHLGAGDRYPEIVRLNYGHDMAGGQVFTDPSLIEPGWQLLLPGGTAAATRQPADTGSHHFGHAAADLRFGRRHSPAGHELPARPTGRVATQDSPSAAAGAVPGSGSATSSAAASLSTHSVPRGLPAPATFVTGALAGAVLTSLGQLRRRQRQERRRGRRIALPADPDVLAVEQRLLAVPAPEPLDTLRDALACLEAGILGAGQELPDIVGLHVTPEVLEVLLATPAADGPPAPYSITPGRQGMCWQLQLPAIAPQPGAAIGRSPGASHEPASSACHLLPGLITAGATESGYLLLDLEAARVVGCDGPSDLVDQVVATIATELSSGQWSGWYDLVLVGCDELEALGCASHCATLDQALDLLEARCAALAPRIGARAPADVRELRLAEPDNEDWGLTVLVSRAEPGPAQMTRLLQLGEDGPGGLAALVAGDPEAADGRMAPTVLQVAPDPAVPGGVVANIVPLQITVQPRPLSAADYDAIGALFSVAARVDDVAADQEPYRGYAAAPWIPQASALQPRSGADWPAWTAQADDSEADSAASAEADSAAPAEAGRAGNAGVPGGAGSSRLKVKVLGPFTILGAAERVQPKQAELVLALALASPAGLSNSALRAMLGADPDHPKPTDAVRQIITRTRRRLGLASDGQEYIIHAGNGQYVLHPEASLDWSEFRQLIAAGQGDDLRAAVALISGQPFTGCYFWWIDIPLIETVRADLVDAAETLAEFELATGSPRAAARAARAGLMAEASAEQLWRAVMRAEHAQGNLAAVTEAWRRCLDAIDDVAPGGEPHPDTAALYRQLTMPARQHV